MCLLLQLTFIINNVISLSKFIAKLPSALSCIAWSSNHEINNYTKNKWYFKVCCALGWWLKFTMQSCFGATNWLPGCHGEKSCFIYNIYNYRVHFHQAIYQCTRMFDILVSMLMFAMSKNYLDWDHS